MEINFRELIERYLMRCRPGIKKDSAIQNFVFKLEEQVGQVESKKEFAEKIGYAIDSILISYRRNKAKLVDFISGFCRFLQQEEGIVIEASVFSAEIIDDPAERRIRIACFLHEPKEMKEIVSHFFASERTIRKDLAALRDGITFMGQRIQIEKVREGRKIRYKSTLHPIFLPLNLTEVYILTVGLLSAVPENHPFYMFYEYLAKFIFSQLSGYGKKIIYDAAAAEDTGYMFSSAFKISGGYRDEPTLIRRREGALAYMMKRGEECDITYIENGSNKKICGRIRFSSKNASVIEVKTNTGVKEIEYAKIVRIVPVEYR
ncbi:MAG: hypothetical protein GX892_01530 [Thermoanaerobacteraceae bacterium]|nr:hypothetical protein [Thermoanaerobacteraceae bacterium]